MENKTRVKEKVTAYTNLLKAYRASCRVQARKAMGSCTIIYSKDGHTYALTNFHVIESSLSYKEIWDSLIQDKVLKEFREAVEVLFPRLDGGRVIGYSTVLADIEYHHEQQDLALLKFRDKTDFPAVKWYPREKVKDIPILSTLACIGAALGQKPIVTFGHLNGIQIEIDNYEYWMSSAPSIFGNSGGGVFIREGRSWYFLGIPSRISVVPLGFAANAITHIGLKLDLSQRSIPTPRRT